MNESETAPLGPVYRLATAVFISTLGTGVFAFAVPLLVFQGKGNGILLGTAFSGYFCVKFLVSPVAGTLSDRVGPRKLLAIAAAIGVFAPLAAFFSRDSAILYAIQICLGLCAGVMKPVSAAVFAAQVPPSRQGSFFGLCNALYNAAFFLGPLLGGLLYFHGNLWPILTFLSVCMGISLWIILIVVSEDTTTTVKKTTPTQIKHAAIHLSCRSTALLLAICGRTAGTASLMAFYPILLSHHLHGPAWSIGMLAAVPGFAAFLSLPAGGRLADRYPKVSLAVSGMILSAVALALTATATTTFGFLMTGLLMGLGSGISFPAAMTLAAAMGQHQGRNMGWFHTAANAGFVVGPLLCGGVTAYSGELTLALATIGILGTLTALPLAVENITLRWAALKRPVAITVIGTAVAATLFLGLRTGAHHEASSQADPLQESPLNFAGVAMGNVIRMTLLGVDRETGNTAYKAATATVSQLASEFGHRNSSGAVGRINMAAGTAPVSVSPPAFELIQRALNFCSKTDRIFDITIGAVTVLPYYYQQKAQTEKASLVDCTQVVMDRTRHTVFLPQTGMALDLGGLAKGTVLDAAAQTLNRHGVPSGLVEAGGDMYCYGNKDWRIGIQDPRGDGLLGVITVRNAGVCGSGDYYQYAITQEDGTPQRKHHILDPNRLDSADKSIAVTVVAPSAELADALATTLFILGPVEGQQLLKKFSNSSALWVLPDQSLVKSNGFPFKKTD